MQVPLTLFETVLTSKCLPTFIDSETALLGHIVFGRVLVEFAFNAIRNAYKGDGVQSLRVQAHHIEIAANFLEQRGERKTVELLICMVFTIEGLESPQVFRQLDSRC